MNRIHQTLIEFLFLFKRSSRIIKYIIFKKSPNFPLFFQIQTINHCNGSCTMCPKKNNQSNQKTKMSDKFFQKIIEEISKEGGFRCIVLHLQNEPLLDNDIFQKIQLIKKIGKGRLITFFATNGTLFSNDKILELEQSGLDELVVSLDASREETYNKIRQGLDYKKVLNNIQRIAKSKFNGNFSVGFVKQSVNLKEFNEFKKMCNKMNVKTKISRIGNRTGDLDNFKIYNINKKDMSYFERIESYLIQKVIKVCPFTINWINILNNGDIIVCCNDYNKKIIIGNLNHSTIKEIWNNKQFETIRRLQVDKRYKEISTCKMCSLFYNNFN